MREEQTDPQFVQFKNMSWGYRAAFCVLRTYRTRYGACTPRKIVARWAPDCENDTQIYLRMVCALTGMQPDEPLESETDVRYMPLVAAMSRIENGRAANLFDIKRGWMMYLG